MVNASSRFYWSLVWQSGKLSIAAPWSVLKSDWYQRLEYSFTLLLSQRSGHARISNIEGKVRIMSTEKDFWETLARLTIPWCEDVWTEPDESWKSKDITSTMKRRETRSLNKKQHLRKCHLRRTFSEAWPENKGKIYARLTSGEPCFLSLDLRQTNYIVTL